jgi:hypothetical protein
MRKGLLTALIATRLMIAEVTICYDLKKIDPDPIGLTQIVSLSEETIQIQNLTAIKRFLLSPGSCPARFNHN